MTDKSADRGPDAQPKTRDIFVQMLQDQVQILKDSLAQSQADLAEERRITQHTYELVLKRTEKAESDLAAAKEERDTTGTDLHDRLVLERTAREEAERRFDVATKKAAEWNNARYDEKRRAESAELRLATVEAAAKAVVWFDWSNNDQDAVRAIAVLANALLPTKPEHVAPCNRRPPGTGYCDKCAH